MAIQNAQELQFEQQLEDHKQRIADQLQAAKSKFESDMEGYKATQDIHLVSFKATLDFGAYASRGMLILNGGSALALLAFLGSVKATERHATMLAPCLATFAVGAFFAVGTMGFTYLAQAMFTYGTRQRRDHSPTGYCFQGVSVIGWFVSAAMFILGLWRTARVFSADFNLWSVLGL